LAQFEKSLKVVDFFLGIPLQTIEKEKGLISSQKKKKKKIKKKKNLIFKKKKKKTKMKEKKIF